MDKKKEEEKNFSQISKVVGILHEYANPELIPLEEGAWERAVAQKHLKLLEEIKNREN